MTVPSGPDPAATDPEDNDDDPALDPVTDTPTRRHSDKLIVALTATVQSMADRLEELSGKLNGFTTTGEVNQKVADLESRMNVRSLIGGLAIVVLAGVFAWYSNYNSSESTKKQFAALAEARHQGQIDNCETNKNQNQVMRSVVDRSIQNQPSLDVTRLSPAAQEILAEFARASADGSASKDFRNFVYALTPIDDCNAKYPPLTATKAKTKAKTTTTTKPKVTTTTG